MAKVIVERDICIGCGACWGTCPEVFEQNAYESMERQAKELLRKIQRRAQSKLQTAVLYQQ